MYKDTEFVYAVARIRANETKLLPSSVLESAISASDYDECKKVFFEAGYGDFDKNDADELLQNKKIQALKLIHESAPDKKCLDFIIIANDIHNIKALLKSKVTGENADSLLLHPTVFDCDLIKKCVQSLDFESLPALLIETVKKAYDIVTSSLDGQMLEVYLDKAASSMSVSLAKQSGDGFAVKAAVTLAKLKSIKIALRSKRASKNEAFLRDALAEIDGFDNDELIKCAYESDEAFGRFCEKCGFSPLKDVIDKSYSLFEKTSDEIMLSLVKDAKYTSFGISPLVAYYYFVDAEVKNVRIVLSCKKNGISQQQITERVRIF